MRGLRDWRLLRIVGSVPFVLSQRIFRLLSCGSTPKTASAAYL